ncbi:hypothetical protein AB0454_22475 [Streptomyces sp. NPDC093509]|uniref:hypothetical protein n=1 Tax=Streptomyces sp. NPDC093509 TaxID=3154982 RepID=UPI00344FC80C
MTTRKQKPRPGPLTTPEALEKAAAAAEFLAGQEITSTECPECGSHIAGIKGRYSCGACGWSNPWHEGHGILPTAEDDVDWPGHKAS